MPRLAIWTMSLRTRILLSVGLTLAILLAGITHVSSRMMLRSFASVERQDAVENVARTDRSFAGMVNEIHVKSADWSSWDDAYRFMSDGNEEFVKSNLVPSALTLLHLDIVLFVDRQGRLFKSQVAPREGTKEAPVARDVLAALDLRRLTADPKMLHEGVSGFVRQANGFMMVSVRPILTSDGKGPCKGWIVFGRTFRNRELEILKGLTRLDVAVRRLDDPGIENSPKLADAARRAALSSFVEPLDEHTIAGHTILRDLNGRLSLLLSMQKPRAIYRQGLASVSQIQTLIVVAGLVFGVVILFVLERFALRRLAKLSAEVAAIDDASRAVSVRVSGRDELSRLGDRINEMLAKLRESEERLQSYNANLEKTVLERTREMEHQAFHDKLTGLPNRALFMDRIGFALSKAGRTCLGTAAFFIDLDNFKLVNDSLGHGVGDALLIAVADRLRESVRPGDTVARLGGDEFTVLLEDLANVAEAEEVARRILWSLRTPISLEGHEMFANASLGIAFAVNAGTSAEGLMKNADLAMYSAKLNGKSNYAFYDERMNDHVVERLELETGLRKALEQDELSVHYQPLIDLVNGRLRGAEALARWTHPTLGDISPARFVPIAEEIGLIVSIGYWVLEEACFRAMRWREECGAEDFSMSVNLSGKQLQRADVVERVAEILAKTSLPPACLKLEITESVLMTNREDVVEKMHRLKSLGIKLALDDFGTGYSSLSTLSAFPIDTLKIDRAFISRLGDEQEATSIVRAIVALSMSMKMDVTGEGVETDSQMRLIQELGCQTGQGYLFDKPLSAAEFEKRLSVNGWREICALDDGFLRAA